jgi:sorting nexin-8
MGPRRQPKEFKLKSIFEPTLVVPILGEKHATQVWLWLLRNPQATSVADIPFNKWSISYKASGKLKEEFVLFSTKVAEKFDSVRGDTTKLLVELQDGHQIETVVMKHHNRNTVCVSSQVGCQMGCRFCATGTMGIIGDLMACEIIEQLVHANHVAKIRNVVFMGMGEPLNNYNNVKHSIEFMVDARVMALSPKHVTVSTVGVINSMYRLTAELPAVNLALSLHAPNQEVRLKIVPAASAHKLDKLMEAIDNHIKNACNTENFRNNGLLSRQGVMMEYILIRDVNDRPEHAHELGQLLLPRREYILLNLIPYNPTDVAEDYAPPLQEDVERFWDICKSPPYNIHTRMRTEMGQDIAGACGQLALVKNPNQKNASLDLAEQRDIEDTMDKKKTGSRMRNPKSTKYGSKYDKNGKRIGGDAEGDETESSTGSESDEKTASDPREKRGITAISSWVGGGSISLQSASTAALVISVAAGAAFVFSKYRSRR